MMMMVIIYWALSTMASTSHTLFHLIIPYEVDIIIPSLCKLRKLRPREIKDTQGHTVSDRTLLDWTPA